jgi:hypothetical protein
MRCSLIARSCLCGRSPGGYEWGSRNCHDLPPMPKEQESSGREIAAVLCVRPTLGGGEPSMIHDAVIDGIARHKGRLVAGPGPLLFVMVGNSLVALACAIEIQQDIAARNASLPDARRITVAIGIDVGEVDATAHDLSGWTADIAAQLAEMAAGDEVLVSQFARQQATARSKFMFEDRGEATITADAPPITVHRLLFESRPHAFVPRVRGATFRRRLWTTLLLVAGVAALYAVSYFQGGGAN